MVKAWKALSRRTLFRQISPANWHCRLVLCLMYMHWQWQPFLLGGQDVFAIMDADKDAFKMIWWHRVHCAFDMARLI